ncbi:polygalacturonase-like [Dioscorea cayenensis subsp. rotundata]|uniref:Exopolygalacturonase n=1 Tax=Dioscorea cayennensis subsp. rotundata TaxID=55577 RepID=A0AB40BR20_DIOCR|nr:polygalacturonase-like [Dioscorea cayenensis subsp. rotundata]
MVRTSLCKDFVVTDYGAKPDGKTESSKAFLKAWSESCEYNGSARFIIPKGTFYLYPVTFAGPCYNHSSPMVVIQGTLSAPLGLAQFATTRMAWIEFRVLSKLVVNGGGIINGNGQQVWPCIPRCGAGRKSNKMPINILFSQVHDTTISNIHSLDSKGVHLKIQRSWNVTVHNIDITAPGNSPNTDGIYSSLTNLLTLSNINIKTGDDCIAIGQGCTNVLISNIHCGPGHGISVGSLGAHENERNVAGLVVKNCTVSNTTNGVRIKTWGGSKPGKASNITFENIVMKNVSNPIIIDQGYCQKYKRCTNEPSLIQLENIKYKNISGTSFDEVGVTFECSEAVPCKGVSLEDINLKYVGDDDTIANITSSCTFALGKAMGFQNPNPCLSS